MLVFIGQFRQFYAASPVLCLVKCSYAVICEAFNYLQICGSMNEQSLRFYRLFVNLETNIADRFGNLNDYVGF